MSVQFHKLTVKVVCCRQVSQSSSLLWLAGWLLGHIKSFVHFTCLFPLIVAQRALAWLLFTHTCTHSRAHPARLHKPYYLNILYRKPHHYKIHIILYYIFFFTNLVDICTKQNNHSTQNAYLLAIP